MADPNALAAEILEDLYRGRVCPECRKFCSGDEHEEGCRILEHWEATR